jgi:hypothetical protein
MKLLAIDPGSTQSAYVVVDTNQGLAPVWFDKIRNEELLELPHLTTADHIAIEQVGHYGTGMPAGKDVFDTCIWLGRYWQKALTRPLAHDVVGDIPIGPPSEPPTIDLVLRKTVVTHICGSSKAGDPHVIQALVDRFGRAEHGRHGKGVKDNPGWFFGFAGDVWQCYALAVYIFDTRIAKGAA